MKDNDQKLIWEKYMEEAMAGPSGVEAYQIVKTLTGMEVPWKIVDSNKVEGGAFNVKLANTSAPMMLELLGQGPNVVYAKLNWRDPFTAPEAPPKIKEWSGDELTAINVLETIAKIIQDFI